MLVQVTQDALDVKLVIIQRVGEDEDIVEVDHYEDVSHVSEDVIYKHLKHNRGIGEPHWHN